jgi:peroxiredoxin
MFMESGLCHYRDGYGEFGRNILLSRTSHASKVYVMFKTFVLLTILTLTWPSAFAEGDIPSYEESVKAFQAQIAKDQGPVLSDHAKAVMAKTEDDLAKKMPSPELKVGEQAPDFTLPDAQGNSVTLSDALSEVPVILAFYRSAWCPYCNLELKVLRESMDAFRALGAQLIAVTPQKPDKSLEQVRKDGFPFPILSDLNDKVMQDYGLLFEVPEELSDVYIRNFELDIPDYNGEGRCILPVPATYVIDRQGVIHAAFADTDFRKRMEPADIHAALETLQ